MKLINDDEQPDTISRKVEFLPPSPVKVPSEATKPKDAPKSPRKKHMRRTNKEIDKNFICPYNSCGKVYGSEGSLNLHIKIKHNGGNKTDRERLAKTLVYAHMNGTI